MLDNLARDFVEKGTVHEAIFMLRICRTNGWYNISLSLGKFFREKFLSKDIAQEMALAAYYLGNHALSYELFADVLTQKNIDEKFAKVTIFNQHFCIKSIEDNYVYYDKEKVDCIVDRQHRRFPMITFTITTCKRYDLFEKTMNSFINCCQDIDKIDHWLCVDDNSSEEDRKKMKEKYPFFEFYFKTPSEKGHVQSMNIIKKQVTTPYMFHMEDDWKFFAKRDYISECMEVIETNPSIGQCLINKNYTETERDVGVIGGFLNKTRSGMRFYIHEHTANKQQEVEFVKKNGYGPNSAYWHHFSLRPSLLKTHILKELGNFDEKVSHFEMEYSYRYTAKGYLSAFLESIYCLHTGRLTSERFDKTKINAYTLNNEAQFHEKEEKVETKHTDLNMKTYVLNLDRRPDRWEKFQKHEAPKCLNYERFSAVDGAQIFPTEQLQRIFDGNDYDMRQGMVGCAMSHLKMYVELINSEYDMFCILEDDVEFVPDFKKKFMHVVSELDENWDMCYLGHHLWKKYRLPEYYDKEKTPILEKWDRVLSLQRSMGGTGGYLISKKGAVKLLEFINRTGMTNGIDTVQQKSGDELDIYYCKPHLIYSECWTGDNNPDTDIQHNFTSLTIPIELRYKQELDFYGKDIVTLETYDEAKTYITTLGKELPAIYKGENVRDLIKLCIYPCYQLSFEALVIVPNPDKKTLDTKCFDRLKRNGVFNIDEALLTKEVIKRVVGKKITMNKVNNVISIGEMTHTGEVIKALGFSQQEYPFDKLDGPFETFALMTEMVLKMDDKELEKYVDDMFDMSENTTYTQKWNGKQVFKNVKYDLPFPHDEVKNIANVYKTRFKNLRDKILSGEFLVFVHVSRWKTIDTRLVYHFLDVISARNKSVCFITINGIQGPLDSKYKTAVLRNSVEFDSRYRTDDWPVNKIRYDQTVFKPAMQKAIKSVLDNVRVLKIKDQPN